MDTLTVHTLAEVLKEPNKELLGRVLRRLGQERCSQVLTDALALEASGSMLTKDGTRRRTPGGTFFQLVRDRWTGRDRHRIFASQATPGQAPWPQSQAQAPSPAPVDLTLDLWKGLRPMPVTATLKLVLRDMPETRERGGMVYMALHNEPKGLPKEITLDAGPLYLTAPVKQWKTACTKAEQIRAQGTPALMIVETHVSTKDGALIGVVKGVQVVEGKTPAPNQV